MNSESGADRLPFDSHAHYFDSRFEREYPGGAPALLETLLGKEICGAVNVGTRLETSRLALEQARAFPGLYCAVGIHPEDCHTVDYGLEEGVRRLEEMILEDRKTDGSKIVAVGEIGLDYHYPMYGEIPMDKEREKAFFCAQMELARKYGLPVVIHDRDAHGDCFDLIAAHPGVRGVMHSYSGSAEMVREYVRLGWYISFSGVLTFRNASRPVQAALAVPDDRLLVETDCPYLAPEPYRGSLNHSGKMRKTVERLAEIRGQSAQEIIRLTTDNAQRLFGIRLSDG